ncbi:MAG: DUF2905 domain-containing protein [Cytophagales bacterium]|nr:DUF2905 domain-containing protein [Cytophagales bacterium]
MGRFLILAGLVLIVIGVLFHYHDRIPFLGKLPGDITIKREGFQFYFPIMTSLVISVILSILLYLYYKWKG